MMKKELLLLLSDDESINIEYKTNYHKEIIETIVSFANAKGGKIIIGVNPEKKIVGAQISEESTQRWINEIKSSTSPSVIPDIDILEIEDKKVVVITVREYPVKPVSYKGRYYKRVSNSNHLLGMEEVANEYLKTRNSSWDYYIDEGQDLNAISIEKVEKFITLIQSTQEKRFDDTPMQILQKYGIIKEDKITYGGYLLFAKDFCILSGIQAGRFKTSTDIIDSISLNSDLFTEIDELMIFLRKHMMVEFIITGNPQREERYDYPIDALREIVLNMIVHRDYHDSSDSVIKIFDDRIEFYNPGALWDDLTIEKLLSNNYESKSRNKLIALMFKECGLIEKYGSGIDRIKKSFKKYGLKEPLFEEKNRGFKVIAYKEKLSVGANVGANDILEFIKQNQPVKATIIAEHFNVTQRTIERWIKQLKDEEQIEFRGASKSGGYFAKIK